MQKRKRKVGKNLIYQKKNIRYIVFEIKACHFIRFAY